MHENFEVNFRLISLLLSFCCISIIGVRRLHKPRRQQFSGRSAVGHVTVIVGCCVRHCDTSTWVVHCAWPQQRHRSVRCQYSAAFVSEKPYCHREVTVPAGTSARHRVVCQVSVVVHQWRCQQSPAPRRAGFRARRRHLAGWRTIVGCQCHGSRHGHRLQPRRWSAERVYILWKASSKGQAARRRRSASPCRRAEVTICRQPLRRRRVQLGGCACLRRWRFRRRTTRAHSTQSTTSPGRCLWRWVVARGRRGLRQQSCQAAGRLDARRRCHDRRQLESTTSTSAVCPPRTTVCRSVGRTRSCVSAATSPPSNGHYSSAITHHVNARSGRSRTRQNCRAN